MVMVLGVGVRLLRGGRSEKMLMGGEGRGLRD